MFRKVAFVMNTNSETLLKMVCEWYQCVCVTHVLLNGISSDLQVTYST